MAIFLFPLLFTVYSYGINVVYKLRICSWECGCDIVCALVDYMWIRAQNTNWGMKRKKFYILLVICGHFFFDRVHSLGALLGDALNVCYDKRAMHVRDREGECMVWHFWVWDKIDVALSQRFLHLLLLFSLEFCSLPMLFIACIHSRYPKQNVDRGENIAEMRNEL